MPQEDLIDEPLPPYTRDAFFETAATPSFSGGSGENQSTLYDYSDEESILKQRIKKWQKNRLRRAESKLTAERCPLCRVEFNIMDFLGKRKMRHCRSCGKVFCRKCTEKKIPLGLNEKVFRYDETESIYHLHASIEHVCRSCFDMHNILRQSPLPGKKVLVAQNITSSSAVNITFET